jgi:hypothetical protein
MLKTLLYINFVALIFLLGGCAPGLQGTEMMPKSQVYDTLSNPKNLERNISLGSVVAQKGMGGMSAPITSEQYKEALALGLRQAGWYSPDKSRYMLDANLTQVQQPMIGFSFTVKTTAEYKLTEKSNGKVKYHDILTLPCTVTFSEAFNAEMRLRKATACSVGENITHLLKVLSQRN